MQISFQQKGEGLYVLLSGELDEHNALEARRIVDAAPKKYPRVSKIVFDLSSVTFMDSAAIGFLIGRYKSFARIGLPVYISSPNREADKILTLGGIYAVIPKL